MAYEKFYFQSWLEVQNLTVLNMNKKLMLFIKIFSTDLCTVSRCRTRGESEDHTSEKARKRMHPGFETLCRRHQKSKTGASVPPPPNFLKNKFSTMEWKKWQLICCCYLHALSVVFLSHNIKVLFSIISISLNVMKNTHSFAQAIRNCQAILHLVNCYIFTDIRAIVMKRITWKNHSSFP